MMFGTPSPSSAAVPHSFSSCATDILGSTAFGPVKKDMNGNIEKIRARLGDHPVDSKTLEGMLEAEAAEGKDKTATQALLWLLRGLQFTMIALRLNQADSTQELSLSFTNAYEGTLKKYHNFIVKGIFAVGTFYFCPYALAVNDRVPTGPVPTRCSGNKSVNELQVLTRFTGCVKGLSIS
jgi:hypothetical protein